MGAFYSKASEKCDCQANILMAISKVEENYAGFPDKVAKPRNVGYNALKERLISNSALITDPASCFELLKEYVDFFYDKHFRIEYSAMPDSLVVPIDGKMIEELLNGQNENSIEGIWIDPHGSKIAIMENGKDTFWGVKVASTTDQYPPGFVYFTLARQGNSYSASLYNRKLNIDIPAKKVGNFLKIWNMQLWIRENALLTTLESEEVKSWKENSNGLMFKKINHDFNYLKIPTFENNDREIGSLIALNDSTIRTTPYLLIDLRGNGGGGSGWTSLIPYIATDQIDQGGSYLRVSKENSSRKIADLESYVNSPIPPELKKYFPKEIMDAYRRTYNELSLSNDQFLYIPSVNFPRDTILALPKKVAVIFDGLSGSSTEFFIYLTRQSEKVVTYGQNSLGMMDYVGMSITTDLPYQGFKLYIPPEKSSWTDKNPIDRTGFSQEFPIKEKEELWIDFILQDLPKR